MLCSIIGNAQIFDAGPIKISFNPEFNMETEDYTFGMSMISNGSKTVLIKYTFLSSLEDEHISNKTKTKLTSKNDNYNFDLYKIGNGSIYYYHYTTDLWDLSFTFEDFTKEEARIIMNSVKINMPYTKKVKLKESNCIVYVPKEAYLDGIIEETDVKIIEGEILNFDEYEQVEVRFFMSEKKPINDIISGYKPTPVSVYSNKYFKFHQYLLDDKRIAIMAKDSKNRNYIFLFSPEMPELLNPNAIQKFVSKIEPLKK